jgi:type I restriction enzyme, R subunit
MARDVFRKYKSLYPEEQVKPFIRQFNAIEAVYQQLNQQSKEADVITIIMNLQQLVDESITVEPLIANESDDVSVDLSKLDFDKLKAAFAKTDKKNTVVFDLQRAVEKKLEQMLRENPLRLDFMNATRKLSPNIIKAKA